MIIIRRNKNKRLTIKIFQEGVRALLQAKNGRFPPIKARNTERFVDKVFKLQLAIAVKH